MAVVTGRATKLSALTFGGCRYPRVDRMSARDSMNGRQGWHPLETLVNRFSIITSVFIQIKGTLT
jgi:hypothetical protein